MGSIPPAEFEITDVLVKALLAEQHGELAELSIGDSFHGWDNVMVRLGDEYVVRLPRRQVAAPLIVHEQRWLPILAPQLPVPIPSPVCVGVAGCGYPWNWSVCRWYEGTITNTFLEQGHMRADVFAKSLGQYQSALHTPAPADYPENPWRGIALLGRDERTRLQLIRYQEWVNLTAALALWDAAVAQPLWDGPPLWVQGDPHPLNMLVNDDSTLAAALDFGDITAGDPASDVSSVFMHLDSAAWPHFRDNYRLSVDVDTESLWIRAQGWALSLGCAFLDGSGPGEPLHNCALRTFRYLGVGR